LEGGGKVKLSPLVFIFLIGCGNSVVDSLTVCDFVVDELCVDTNGYPNVTSDLVDFTIKSTATAFNNYLDSINSGEISLAELIKEYGLMLEFVDPAAIPEYRGVYLYSEKIKVRVVDEEQCLDIYYVLGHELLHFASRYALFSGVEKNGKHNVPGIFVQWAIDNGEDYTQTAEWVIFTDVLKRCEG
jgi:hypothetical protein